MKIKNQNKIVKIIIKIQKRSYFPDVDWLVWVVDCKLLSVADNELLLSVIAEVILVRLDSTSKIISNNYKNRLRFHKYTRVFRQRYNLRTLPYLKQEQLQEMKAFHLFLYFDLYRHEMFAKLLLLPIEHTS